MTKYFSIILIGLMSVIFAQQKTYINPINVDYGYTPIPNFAEQGKHRATADPVIVNHQGKYFLFSTNQWGYWWSDDMIDWKFISRKFLKPENKVWDELCAPAVASINDTLVVIGSTMTPNFTLWMSTNPTRDDWKPLVDNFPLAAWDPDIFHDKETDRIYLYWGSSNVYPMYGIELDRKTFLPKGERAELIKLVDEEHGWERFGESNNNVFLKPFMEGAHMTKYKGKYYLQYGAPGTEFSGYADGVYVSDKPLGPFEYQPHNPFSYKPSGFARGAGHGATFSDNFNQYWHVSTIYLSNKNNFERRLGIWPAGFDQDGVMYANTAYGDYPTFLPQKNVDHRTNRTPGWMLLNYQKPVQVSSTLGGFQSNFAVDEDIKTYWSAKTGNKGEWFQTDLGEVSTVNAIQINYADQDAEFLGKQTDIFHQYKIYYSDNGKSWKILIDKSQNKKDVPHDYIELEKPIKMRFLKLENLHMPTGKFALSGFRVFGKGSGQAPKNVDKFVVLRAEPKMGGERRSSWMKWAQNDDADGYVIYFGKAKDKLYGSMMVLGKNEYYFNGMDASDVYYFQIEAFNANGIGPKSPIIEVK